MNILIKNVTGAPIEFGSPIWDLRRVGFPEGSVVRNVSFQKSNKSCHWSAGNDDCVAWLGFSCIKMPKIADVHIFSLKEGGLAIEASVNGTKLGPAKLSRSDTMAFDSRKSDLRQLVINYLIL